MVRRFFKTSLAFLLSLAAVVFVADRIAGWRLSRSQGSGLIAPEVYLSMQKSNEPSQIVRSVYLGDSVARQLFPPGSEPSPDELYLPCNQAISVAGQFYILQNAFKSCPHIHDVYFIYYPGSLTADLEVSPFTNDFFCAFFHSPSCIRDVFALKHDFRLAASQVARMLIPNILGLNSGNRPALLQPGTPGDNAAPSNTGGGGEPLIDALNRFSQAARPFDRIIQPDAQGRTPVVCSPISTHYLKRLREICREHRAAFHFLAAPCSDAMPFIDSAGVYDHPIFYVDSSKFGDRIHVRKPFVADVKRQWIDAQLNAFAATTRPAQPLAESASKESR